jgi:hypothetical protein
VLFGSARAAPAQVAGDVGGPWGPGEGTWPAVSVNLSASGNWIIAEGRSLGQTGQVLWSQRVAPVGEPVTISHGWMTSFITVGNRQFVVDNATGAHQEIALGQAWARGVPGGVTAPPVAPVPAGTGVYRAPYLPEPGYVPPYLPAEPAALGPVPGTVVGSITGPKPRSTAGQVALRHQEALENLLAANQRLLASLTAQENLPAGATAAQVAAAQQAVRQARLDVESAQSILQQRLANDRLPPATQPAAEAAPAVTASQTVTVRHRMIELAQARMTQLMAEANKASMNLDQLTRAQAAPQQIAAAQMELDVANAKLAGSRRELLELQLEAKLPPPVYIDPELRARIGDAERKVIDATEDMHIAQERVRLVRNAVDAGTAQPAELSAAGTHLLASMQKLGSARQELEDLQQTARFFRSQMPYKEWNVAPVAETPTAAASPIVPSLSGPATGAIPPATQPAAPGLPARQ